MTDNSIQSFLESYGQSETGNGGSIPQQSCCCGNSACAYLTHNQSALEGLERDVRTAAKLGQALLVRHEAYIADSEKERKDMMAHIGRLEVEKRDLEQMNANVIEENRSLLDQLEAVNSSATEADTQIANLQATLQSAHLELQKLSQFAARTERLEQQLADYEREQMTWQASLEDKEEAERSALRRWQKAERDLADMHEQVERIEREAKEERERHTEVVERMERRHVVEKELNSAAGRLKGAAAARTSGKGPSEPNVVSHFVKDILSDNANLQMGIVELREMLQNSNDEVESLRKQLSEHQPLGTEDQDKPKPRRSDLREELNRASSQELHVHHHYHAPPPAANKPAPIRRPKKKRYSALSPSPFTPPASGFSTPRSSMSLGTTSSAATILQQTAVSLPGTKKNKRFSAQSAQTYRSMLSSSGPSSPRSSANRTSSLYDGVFSDAGHDSSRPTSPDTEEPGSPACPPSHPARGSLSGTRTVSAPIVHRRGISPSVGRPSMDSVLGTSVDEALDLNSTSAPIPEESETDWQDEGLAAPELDSAVTSPLSDDLLDPIYEHNYYNPPLRRAASHDSLLSVHGMDIHTLKARPSQLLTNFGGRSFTSGAVISDATAHAARPAAMSRPSDSGRSLLSGVAAEQRQPSRSSLGSKVGGWVFGRWGTAPTSTASDNRSVSSSSTSRLSSSASADKAPADDDPTPKKAKPPKMRPPGINQPGPIFGFPAEVKQQRPPVMKALDEEGLKSALGDDDTGQ